jgi:hypothetical protein
VWTWHHDLTKRVKHRFELAVVFTLEFGKSLREFDVRLKHLPESDKGTHDFDVDLGLHADCSKRLTASESRVQ